jgi:hypothetical protein
MAYVITFRRSHDELGSTSTTHIIGSPLIYLLMSAFFESSNHFIKVRGGSNMTGAKCDLFTHNQSRSYLNHLVLLNVQCTFSFCPTAHPASWEVKRLGRGLDHSVISNAEVKERVELYLYFPSGPSWPVLVWK